MKFPSNPNTNDLFVRCTAVIEGKDPSPIKALGSRLIQISSIQHFLLNDFSTKYKNKQQSTDNYNIR